jgi:hypothetical protein
VALLKKLREVAEFQDSQAVFRQQVKALSERYKRRYSLMERFGSIRII